MFFFLRARVCLFCRTLRESAYKIVGRITGTNAFEVTCWLRHISSLLCPRGAQKILKICCCAPTARRTSGRGQCRSQLGMMKDAVVNYQRALQSSQPWFVGHADPTDQASVVSALKDIPYQVCHYSRSTVAPRPPPSRPRLFFNNTSGFEASSRPYLLKHGVPLPF